MIPVVSIIIPCFNSEKFLPEALKSVDAYHNRENIEVIIVDDGSTDHVTLTFLDGLSKERYHIIYQENLGPAAARNKGAAMAKSHYLLFLDSDNKIRTDYIDLGVKVLSQDQAVGVVYGRAGFFGEASVPRFDSKPFDEYKLFFQNSIDVCAVVRKKAFQQIDGFDEARILFGHEDWELWIRMHVSGWKFHFIDKVLFDYRVRINSLLMQKSESDNIKDVLNYVYKKHLDVFRLQYEKLYLQYQFYKKDQDTPVRTFFKNIYGKYFRTRRMD